MRKNRIAICLIILIISGCALPKKETPVFLPITQLNTTTLTENTTWEGEIIIDGTITVPAEVTLTIKPGTIIKFVPVSQRVYGAGNGLIVKGTLIAIGTEKAKIIFTSAASKPQKGDWNDIFFIVSEGEENILDNCVVLYANIGVHGHFCKLTVQNSFFGNNWRAFQFQESELLISNNQFLDNNWGIKFRDSDVKLIGNQINRCYFGIDAFRSHLIIKNNVVQNCYMTSIKVRESDLVFSNNVIEFCRQGLQIKDSSQVNIRESKFINNFENGIYLKNSLVNLKYNEILNNGCNGISIKESGVNANYNNFLNNGKYAVDNDGKTEINARNNWWGTTDDLAIGGQIFDFFDKKDLGKVDFSSFLNNPVNMENMPEVHRE